MNKKPFSKSLYEQDDSAKYHVINWLRLQGFEAQVNPARYGIDVLAEKGDKVMQVEVEVKHNWKGPAFQYDTLHYSGRKKKFLGQPDTTFFITLNHELTHGLLVPGPVLEAAKIIVKDTIYTRNEEFIEVNVADCKLVEIPELEATND